MLHFTYYHATDHTLIRFPSSYLQSQINAIIFGTEVIFLIIIIKPTKTVGLQYVEKKVYEVK